MHKRKRGGFWEKHAAEYLVKNGYEILFQNWTCRWGEIDLIAKKNGTLVFVEVKFRSSSAYGDSWEAVSHYKLLNQARAIKMFLVKEKAGNISCRFDVIGITKTTGQVELRHFEAVLLPQVR